MFNCVPARSVDYYLAGTVADQLEYYFGAKRGIWWTPSNASASALARFPGCTDGRPIDNELFVQLGSGQLPDGTTVGRGGAGVRMTGYDCHFSPPKSVSLIFAFSHGETRRRLIELHNEAVRRALQFLFDWALIGARRGSAGKDREKCAAFVAAIFTEFTSRDNDPQIHSHAVIPNLGVRQDGTVGAIDNYRARTFQLLVGAIYQAHMAAGMLTMGFLLERRGRAFEVQGIPKALIKLFSKRRNTIERVATAMGIDPSRNRAAADVIALDTRPTKSAELPLEQLEIRWRTQLSHAGFDGTSFAPIVQPTEQAGPSPQTTAELAIEEGFVTNAVISKANLFASVAEALIGQCGADEVERQLLHTVPNQVVALVENEATGNTLYSTRAMIELERALLRIARKGRGFRKFVADHLIDAAIVARPTLSQEQQDAVRHALNDDQIAITEGSAGSGKSFKLAAVAEACRAAGLDVWALGPSWAAALVLALDTETGNERKRALSGFLLDIEAGRIQLTPSTVLLLDEAGMVGTEDLQRLATVVHQAGCKLILAGDTMQLTPVPAGAPMRLLARALGTSRMSQIRRQKLAWSRAASMEFAKGHAAVALRIYQARGNIDWIKGRAATLTALADRYFADMIADRANFPDRPLPTCLAITSRNAEVGDLNTEIRTRLQSAGFISADDVEVGVALRPKDRNKRKQAGTIKLAVGDKLVFGETVELHDRIIRNADVAKVVAVQTGTPPHLTLEFEADGVRIACGIDELVGFRAANEVPLPLLRHAYAGTVHFAQGQTVDRAYVASIHAMSREAMYVAMTRHRYAAQLFVDTSRLKAARLAELPSALLALLNRRDRKVAQSAAQMETKRQAFFEESERPDSKANASDFVADLDNVPNARPTPPAPSQSRYAAVRAATLHRLSQRSQANLGEAAQFDKRNPTSGLPNWLYRMISPVHLGRQSLLGPSKGALPHPERLVRPGAHRPISATWLAIAALFRGDFAAALSELGQLKTSLGRLVPAGSRWRLRANKSPQHPGDRPGRHDREPGDPGTVHDQTPSKDAASRDHNWKVPFE